MHTAVGANRHHRKSIPVRARASDRISRLLSLGLLSAILSLGAGLQASEVGLVGWWKLDDGSGSTAKDSSGLGNHGTVAGSPSWGAGKLGGGLNLDGVDDRITLPNSLLAATNVLTISLWFRTASEGVLVGYQNAAYPDRPQRLVPAIYVGSDGRLRAQFATSAVNPITSSTAVDNNAWHHVALVGNSSAHHLYLDGALVGSLKGSISHSAFAYNQLGVGRFSSWPGTGSDWTFFQGGIDDVRIYHRALTAAEVTALVNPPSANTPPVAKDLAVSTKEDTPIAITLSGTDADGDALSFAVASSPAKGKLTGTAPNLSYTPNANFNGSDGFTFTVSDGKGGSDTGSVSITVTAVNDAPVAQAGSASTVQDQPVVITLKGNDVDGDSLTFAIALAPSKGKLGSLTKVSATSSTVTYTPNAGYSGSDSFTFKVSDGKVASAAATIGITVSAATTANLYEIAAVGFPGGSMSVAKDINETGVVVGDGFDSNGQWLAFKYANGTTTSLGRLNPLGVSWGADINDKGQTTGSSMNASFNLEAYFHDGSTMKGTGNLPGGSYSYAYGMNNHGHVVGFGATTLGATGFDLHAFVWKNGVITDLGGFGGIKSKASIAWAINDLGQVVGEAQPLDLAYTRPTIWTGGKIVDLSQCGDFGFAYDINNKGQVVGNCRHIDPDGTSHHRRAIFWDSDLSEFEIGGLAPHSWSDAWGINENGVIVGEADTSTGARHAVMWKSHTQAAVDLNKLIPAGSGWVLTVAYGINDKGLIVGTGMLNGVQTGFLLTPTAANNS